MAGLSPSQRCQLDHSNSSSSGEEGEEITSLLGGDVSHLLHTPRWLGEGVRESPKGCWGRTSVFVCCKHADVSYWSQKLAHISKL